MDESLFRKRPRLNRVYTKPVFTVSVFVMVVTILAVWLLGLGRHRALYVNSLLSVTILSAAFLLYIISGLYRGIKLKDNVGKITDKIGKKKFSGLNGIDFVPDGCGSDIEGVFAWLAAAFVAVILLWVLGSVFWILILIFMAMLYWIFFRAMRLVFRKSPLCKGNLLKSIVYGTYYTILYNCWIYGIIMGAHWLVQYRH